MNNLNDPFVDDSLKLHLHVQQRNARQKITIISGFPEEFETRELLKKIKKKLCCNGAVLPGNELQLTGDQRSEALDYLVGLGVVERRNVVIHGY